MKHAGLFAMIAAATLMFAGAAAAQDPPVSLGAAESVF